MILNINQLRYFFLTATLNSVSAAAKAMLVTPPAVTMQIKQLENTLGFRLIQRKGNSISLTAAGEQVMAKAKPLFDQIGELERELEAIAVNRTHELKIGCHYVPARYIMPDLIGAFNAFYPQVKMVLETGNTSDLLVKIENHDIPLALVAGRPDPIKFQLKPLLQDDVLLVAAGDSRIVPEGRLSVRRLASLPMIIQEKTSSITDIIQRYLAKHDISPQIVMESASLDVMKDLLIKDTAVGFMERFAVREELRQKRLKAIAIIEGLPVIELSICYLKGKNTAPIVPLFLKTLEGREFLGRS